MASEVAAERRADRSRHFVRFGQGSVGQPREGCLDFPFGAGHQVFLGGIRNEPSRDDLRCPGQRLAVRVEMDHRDHQARVCQGPAVAQYGQAHFVEFFALHQDLAGRNLTGQVGDAG